MQADVIGVGRGKGILPALGARQDVFPTLDQVNENKSLDLWNNKFDIFNFENKLYSIFGNIDDTVFK